MKKLREKKTMTRALAQLTVLIIGVAVVVSVAAIGGIFYEMKLQNTHASSNTISTTSTFTGSSEVHSTSDSSLQSQSAASSTVTNSANNSSMPIGTGDGNVAPNFPITLVYSSTNNLSSLHAKPVLLWFVATWCSSCQQGAQMLNQQYYSELHAKGVVIVIVELYNDLGQSGPNLTQFATQYGGGLNKLAWYYGYSNQTTTYTFDPKAALDVYYALNPQGVIVTQGIGLPNALASLSTDSSWFD